ncbi:MAG: (2Fe-2S)-binding protein [Chloroflexota bacterium]|nr:(2Fe-2S)-binding protein [Chloroflexota bacterium]
MPPASSRGAPARVLVALTINGRRYEGLVEPRKLLVDFIREDAGLTGTHAGCEHGVCGACTVIMDGATVRSCLTFAVQAHGRDLWTVEGLARDGQLSPLQTAFWQNHGLQCGFCTPGILMTAVELLEDNPNPTEADIREAISGNLCRCTGYENIVKSITAAAQHYRQGEPSPGLTRPVHRS